MNPSLVVFLPASLLVQAPEVGAQVRRFMATPWTRVERLEDFPPSVRAAILRRMRGEGLDGSAVPEGQARSRMRFGGRAPGLAFLYVDSGTSPFGAELLLFAADRSGRFRPVADWSAPLGRKTIDELRQAAREGGLTPVDHRAR